ncbi:hypothetical protein F4558_002805 [Micromonospora profundi]|uniref:nuclear transport factor 2 family protein n=1 Tax=Micromonospora profundi TaxID=1420889 RepID=UPI00143C4AA5|nr:nuclear transport factor 2 family protein [Micromonospora profundi]NJC12979.1 hypothetical protein [Micromonospora profundi]
MARTEERHDAGTEVQRVLEYLRHTEAGRLDEARAYLSPRVRHTFPGGREFADLSEWFGWFRARMRRVRKRDHEIDVCHAANGDLVIYVRGFLEGETTSGHAFDGVRFIDRFVVSAGQIVEQQVWNDLAACGVEPEGK